MKSLVFIDWRAGWEFRCWSRVDWKIHVHVNITFWLIDKFSLVNTLEPRLNKYTNVRYINRSTQAKKHTRSSTRARPTLTNNQKLGHSCRKDEYTIFFFLVNLFLRFWDRGVEAQSNQPSKLFLYFRQHVPRTCIRYESIKTFHSSMELFTFSDNSFSWFSLLKIAEKFGKTIRIFCFQKMFLWPRFLEQIFIEFWIEVFLSFFHIYSTTFYQVFSLFS